MKSSTTSDYVFVMVIEQLQPATKQLSNNGVKW